MSQSVTIGATTYSFPTAGDTDWAAIFEAWAAAISARAESIQPPTAEDEVNVAVVAGVVALDAAAANVFYVSVTATINEFTVTDGVAGQRITVVFATSGAYTFAAAGGDCLVYFSGGAFALSGSGVTDVVGFVWDDTGGRWLEESRSLAVALVA